MRQLSSVLAHGVKELPPGGGVTYQAFTDVSGGSADSFTMAIGHMEPNGIAVLDVLREVRPPFSPDNVVQEYSSLLKSYGVSRITGDFYGGIWPTERFAAHGISYQVSSKNKSQIYLEFLPALNGQRVRLLDIPRLIGQFVGLERRTARGGRDSVDHQPGGNDDACNAAAGLLVNLLEDRRPALVKPADMAAPAHLGAYQPPGKAAYIAAVMVVDDSGTAAYVIGAQDQASPSCLFICDFAVEPLGRDIFVTLAAKMDELVRRCRATSGAALFVHADLLAHARAAGVRAELIPKEFEAENRLLSVAGHVASGAVKITLQVTEKAKT